MLKSINAKLTALLSLFFTIMAVFLISMVASDFRFTTFGAKLIYAWTMAMFVLAILYIWLKSPFREVFAILPICMITTELPIFAFYHEIVPGSESVAFHRLKNDPRMAVTYFLSGGNSIKATRFLAETHCFGIFYKRVSKEVYMDPDVGDSNLENYVLDDYSKDDKFYLFVVREESLLVDIKRLISKKVRTKPPTLSGS